MKANIINHPEIKTLEDYAKLQETNTSAGRGSMWGDRVVWSIERYHDYFHPEYKVLDIGCNDGIGLEEISKLGCKVVGVDIVKKKLKEAEGLGFTVKFGYQEDLPFDGNEFDMIFSSHTLEHSYNRERTASEMHRVAARGIIIVPIEPISGKSPSHCSRFGSIKEFKDLFKDKGKIVFEEKLHRLQEEYAIIIDFK